MQSAAVTYALYGVLFGLMFPVVAALYTLILMDFPFTLGGVMQARLHYAPLTYLIDTAPLFLGLFAVAAGRRQDHLRKEIDVRKEAEKELHAIRDDLRLLVAQKTAALNRSLEEQDQALLELAHAIARIKVLDGLVPICSNCKKIRDDHGFWNLLEDYISAHSDAQFSHGICPDCIEELYPKVWAKMQKDKTDQAEN